MRKKLGRVMVRKATLRDMDVLVDHRRRLFSELHPEAKFDYSAWAREYKRFVRKHMRGKRFVAFLTQRKDGAVIATGAVWIKDVPPRPMAPPVWIKEPYLLSMYTLPEYRGYGLATRIVKEAMKWSKSKGFSRMSLHASEMGRPVYKKLGWERGWEMRIRL